ncbi:serine/threonine-protein kinase [Streptomyces roseus]|uniref:Serine/threonine protein kinase n=1 Tax=Streptomyces roseus TaxID=66430 RepID=A0A0J7ABF5_9ACTN|nr:serine/threonine-protein kinase [Streptomyces roseus]KMO94571.1 serine/threonine protein kinase [Streptomyces roseus]
MDTVFHPLEGDDPRSVAGYRIVAKLGAGGMGKVYLSYTPGGRPVAIKVIRPEFGEDAEFRRRFQQEVRAAERVQGLYTAPVIDSDTEGRHPWLATAYVPGPSLADAVQRHGALPVATVLLLVAGVAEALQVIHKAGIVHRDLKPSNVLLAGDGPRVIDFGIARAADATALTGSGVTIGTPTFMAPEQAAGGAVTPATDIFALGQVAAYAATGLPAFGEGTSHGVLYRIVHEQPDLTRLPPQLQKLVAHCLAKEPAARPSVDEVLALCRAANGDASLRRPEAWLPGAVAADITLRGAAPAPPEVTRVPQTQAPAPPGREPTVSAAPAAPPAVQGAYGPPTPHPPGPYAQPSMPPGYPPQPSAPGRPTRRPGMAVAVGLALALLAGGGVYLLNRNSGTEEQATGKGKGATTTPNASQSPAGATKTPEPVTRTGINLPENYTLRFDDGELRPQDSGGSVGDLQFGGHSLPYRVRTQAGNHLALLDPGQSGSLETCRDETRFADYIPLDTLSPGAQFCVLTTVGHIGLITFRGQTANTDPAFHVTLDATVWRRAVAPS